MPVDVPARHRRERVGRREGRIQVGLGELAAERDRVGPAGRVGALVPEGEDPRRAVGREEVGMGEVDPGVDDPDDDALAARPTGIRLDGGRPGLDPRHVEVALEPARRLDFHDLIERLDGRQPVQVDASTRDAPGPLHQEVETESGGLQGGDRGVALFDRHEHLDAHAPALRLDRHALADPIREQARRRSLARLQQKAEPRVKFFHEHIHLSNG